MTAACRSCAAPVLWAITGKGHRVPLDVEPVAATARGALVLVKRDPLPAIGGGTPTPQPPLALSLDALVRRLIEKGVPPMEAQSLAEEFPARLSHFSSCPDAGRHRRRNS